MAVKLTEQEAASRRMKVLHAARWCFLHFGFSKTSLDDIAKRASISRTLLYRMFRDKEDIFMAVFEHWLMLRLPDARAAAERHGDVYQRLLDICRIVALEPWETMAGAPMADDFFPVCERIDPEITAQHRKAAHECFAQVLGDAATAEVFLLALDGLLADTPTPAALEQRTQILAAAFARRTAPPLT